MTGASFAAGDVLQMPLVLGAMSIFTSANVPAGIRLTPCVLAKIFSRQIVRWDDTEIAALNAGTTLPANGINVLHRTRGSSTTNFFTQYLHEATRSECPSAWIKGYGASLTSDTDVANTATVTESWGPDVMYAVASGGMKAVQGSGMMANDLASEGFSIGYLDSGHGHADGLNEVELSNAAGNYISSLEAGTEGVQSAAASATYPATSAGDWSTVSLLNVVAADPSSFWADGVDRTWPIVAISYLFVKRDLSDLGESAAALKALLELAMSTEKGYSSTKGGQKYAGDFKFTALPANLLATNNAGIATLQLPTNVEPFQWEWSTSTTVGPARNTLSCKRTNYATYATSSSPSDGAAGADGVDGAAGASGAAGAAGAAGEDGGVALAIVALLVSLVNLGAVGFVLATRGSGTAEASDVERNPVSKSDEA